VDLSLFISAGALISAGLTEDAGFGVYAGAGVRPVDFLSAAVEIRAMLPSRALAREAIDSAKPVTAAQQLDYSNVSALLVPCFHYWYLLGCAVGQVGVSLTRSSLVSADKLSYGAGPRLGVQFPFADRFAASAFGEVLFAAAPTVTYFNDLNAVWRQSLASGFVGVGLSVKLN
jgi:hypothetical protein